METQLLKIQPYPFVYEGTRHGGALYAWHDRCLSCSAKSCSEYKDMEINVCNKGISYAFVSPKILIGGVIIQRGQLTSAQIKAQRSGVQKCEFNKFERNIANIKRAIDMLPQKDNGKPVRAVIKSEPQQTFTQRKFDNFAVFHEFKSIIATIVKNINVIVEMKSSEHAPLDEKLEMSGNLQEKAIYYASRMLEGKLSSFEFIQNNDKIADKASYKPFRFHGLLHKYVQIYKSQFSSKNIEMFHEHNSRIELYTNPDAISVVIQNYIDNSYKYAPQGSAIYLSTKENDREIKFSITSFGPEITDTEKIFEANYREKSAQNVTKDGLGYGLYISKTIADVLGLKLSVKQDMSKCTGDNFKTTFVLVMPFHLFSANRLD